VRSFDEIKDAIDALTPATVMAHLERHPVRDVTLVTLGKNPLSLSDGVSGTRGQMSSSAGEMSS
jgi:hypothetical protein